MPRKDNLRSVLAHPLRFAAGFPHRPQRPAAPPTDQAPPRRPPSADEARCSAVVGLRPIQRLFSYTFSLPSRQPIPAEGTLALASSLTETVDGSCDGEPAEDVDDDQ